MVVTEMRIESSLRAAVVEVGARVSQGQYRLVTLVHALDESGEWALDGAATCAHWIADALDMEVSTAREWLRIGRLLIELPIINNAFAAGRLSYSKVRTLTRLATPENEAELCDLAARVPAAKLARVLAAWLNKRETPEQTEQRQLAAEYVSWHTREDGMVVGTWILAPGNSAALTTKIDTHVRTNRPRASADAWPSIAKQRAEALTALANGETSGPVVTEIVLHVRGDGCTLDDGTPISETFVERIAPSAFLRALIHDADQRPVNASGRRRHPTTRQKRVVHERDRACVDCGSTELLDYDHVPDFDISQRTVVEELRRRCMTCHHRRHGQRRGHS